MKQGKGGSGVFRVDFTHSVEGTIQTRLNVKELTINIDRNVTFKSLFLSYSGDLELVDASNDDPLIEGNAKTFVDNIYSTYGIDSEIQIEIYRSEANYPVWLEKYTGVLDGEQYEKEEKKSIVGFVDSEFERKLVSRGDLDVEYNTNETVEGIIQPGFTNYFQDVNFRGLTADVVGKAVFPFEMVLSIIQKITDTDYLALNSTFFGRDDATFLSDFGISYPSNGPGALTLITLGAYISGFTAKTPLGPEPNERSITVKFSELFKELSNVFNLGLSIDTDDQGRKIVVIEELAYFYQSVVMADVPDCNDLSISYDEKLFAKSIDVSYTKTDDDNEGGIADYNTESKWATECKFGTDLNLQNGFRTDISGLEKAILSPLSGRSDDKEESTDNSIFLEHCYYNGVDLETVKNEDFTILSGIYPDSNNPNNVYLSPARKLARHGNMIRIGTDNGSYTEVKIQNNDSYSKLQSQYIGESFIITETENILTSNLAEPFLSGRKFKLNCTLTQDQIDSIQATRVGLISFYNYIEDVTSYGFLSTCAVDVVNGKAELELLESANLSNLANARITSDPEYRITSDGSLRLLG